MPRTINGGEFNGMFYADVFTKKFLEHCLFELDLSVPNIAKRCCVNNDAVYNYIKKYNIDISRNQFTIQDDYAVIKLYSGHETLVDVEDLDRIRNYTWYAQYFKPQDRFYILMANRFARKDFGKSTVLLHRYILGVDHLDVLVDHENRNSLDNRKRNLRIATPAENVRNSGPSKLNKLGLKGVWKTSKDRYLSQITFEGKREHVGSFDNPIDACIAYNKRAQELFGEFAYLNPVPDFQFLEGDY